MSTLLIAVDIETTGLGLEAEFLGFSIYSEEMKGSYAWSEESRQILIDLIEQGYTFIFHNASFDVPRLRRQGVMVTLYEDTMLKAYCWDASLSSYGLAALADLYCVSSKGERPEQWTEWNEEMAVYCQQDTKTTWELNWTLESLLSSDNRAYKLYKNIELPYTESIIDMETNGFLIDEANLLTFIGEVERDIEEQKERFTKEVGYLPGEEVIYKKVVHLNGSITKTEEKILVPNDAEPPEGAELIRTNKKSRTYAIPSYVFLQGTENGFTTQGGTKLYQHCKVHLFNPGSGKHVAEVLQKRGCELTDLTETGQIATGAHVLDKLDDPLAKSLLDYAELTKLQSTYLLTMRDKRGAGGRLRGNFNQTGTQSGRLSSSSPNLQNIPTSGDYGNRVRRLFVSPPGSTFCSADLSNIEGRVLAHYLARVEQDTTLADVFRSGTDLHMANAFNWGLVEFFNKGQGNKLRELFDKGEVNKSDKRLNVPRQAAKVALYLSMYGGGAAKLGKSLGIGTEAGEGIVSTMKESFPSMFALKEKVWACLEDTGGHIHTEFGRRLTYRNIDYNYATRSAHKLKALPKWSDKPVSYLTKMLVSEAKRSSFNGLIQGTAADVNKLWGIRTRPIILSYGGTVLADVHDERDFELPFEIDLLVKDCCDKVVGCVPQLAGCPVTAEWKSGKSWGETH